MSTADSKRRVIAVVRHFTPTLMASAFVALAWFTVRGTAVDTPFPDALLQAEGAILAGFVVVLGLNQGAVQRGFDAVLNEARGWTDRAAAACTASHTPVAATQVWTWASRDSWVLRFKGGDSLLEEARAPEDIEKYLDDSWAWERLDWGLRVNHLKKELKSAKMASPRRRRRMEREVADLQRRSERSYKKAEDLGVLTAGLRRLYGRALAITARAHRLDRLLSWFTYLLVAALLVGLVRAGPTLASLADPGVWVAVALPLIAATYRRVVARQLLNEANSLVNGLKDSWLIHLHQAEDVLGKISRELKSTLENEGLMRIDKSAAMVVMLHLDRAETSAPEVPWLASLRGRLHLAHAVVAFHQTGLRDEQSDAGGARQGADLRRELATAEAMLRRASANTSDPVTGLALASCLDLSLPDDDIEGREKAEGYACRALDVLERLPPDSWDFVFDRTTGVRLAHKWTWQQSYLLCPEGAELSARFDLVVDHLETE